MEAGLAELETALGHNSPGPELLVRALTHRSLAKELAAIEGTGDGQERSIQATGGQ